MVKASKIGGAVGDGVPDLESFWMPFTPNRQFKRLPRLLVAAQGMHYTTVEGDLILDGIAGLWCCNAGHCHPRIVAAVREQVGSLDYATSFNLGHPSAFELANELAARAPAGLDRVFFVNSGSEAVDTALKIALAYHRARGEGQRFRFIGRERSYHGVGFGGLSVGGLASNRRLFASAMLPGVDHLTHTHDLTHNAFTRGQPVWGGHLADELERLVALHDASSIAGVIVEPIAGSAGVLVPPKGYLERLRKICDKHGILLIFDEVITGFGRTGECFAAQTFGVRPDLMALAKALTGGVIPMGAVLVDRGIHDACLQGPDELIEFPHGYTFSGHPVACAAALAALAVYRDEDLFARTRLHASVFADGIHSLRGAPHVVDIRNFGLMGAIELEAVPGKPGLRATEVFQKCFAAGVLVRVTGDTIALTPPLIIDDPQIQRLVETLARALETLA